MRLLLAFGLGILLNSILNDKHLPLRASPADGESEDDDINDKDLWVLLMVRMII